MTKTKFRRLAKEIGLLFATSTSENAMIPHPRGGSTGEWVRRHPDSGVIVSWNCGRDNRKSSRRFKSIIGAVNDYEKRHKQQVITDPIIRAAHGMEP